MDFVSLHLIAIAALLSWTLIVADDTPHNEIFPRVQTSWGTAVFVCTTTGITNPFIEWRKNGKELQYMEGYDVVDFSNGSVLQIRDSYGDSDDTYACVAENDAGEIVKAKAKLKAPSLDTYEPFPKIQGYVGDLLLDENQTVHLQCLVEDFSLWDEAKVMWFKDMIPLNKREPRYSLSDKGQNLEISDFRKEDEGVYQCMAGKTHTWSFVEIGRLYITKPSLIEIFPLTQTAPIDGTALFLCIPPGDDWRIEWRKNGKRRKSMFSSVINLYNGLSVLRIESVMAETDDAIYECVAENSAGKVESASAHLTVQSEYPLSDGFPRFVQQPNNQITGKGGTILMPCHATGNPQPKIMWFKDNVPLPIPNFPHTRYMLLLHHYSWVRRRFLEISNAREIDQGVYECMATNSHGSVMSEEGYLYVTN